MTVKLVVLYTQPADPAGFDRHYFDTHMPLVNAIPGLLRAETGRFVAAADGGEATYYRIASLYFESPEALDAGFKSPEGTACAKDYAQLAPPDSRMFVATVD
jgi:uncharacterized protein (TIGR02118 family)